MRRASRSEPSPFDASRSKVRLAVRTAFVLLFLGKIGFAQTAQPIVAIDCPTMGTEARAALEARAKTEFIVRRETGTFVVACRGAQAFLAWRPLQGPGASAAVSIDDRGIVENVLEGLDTLFSNAPNAAVPDAAAPSAAVPSADSAAVPVVALTPPPSPPAATPPSPVPRTEPRVSPVPRHDVSLALGLGAFGELWSSEVGGAVGGRAFGELHLRGKFGFEGGAGIGWTLASPARVGARLLRGYVGARYSFDDRGRGSIGMGFILDSLRASAGSPLEAPAATKAAVGAVLSARYALFDGPARVSTGPTLAFHPGPVKVVLDGAELFRIPTVAVGWTIDGIFGPW